MLTIDLCITAARRPALLAETLQSFQQNLFRHVRIERVIANIDPVFGDESDQRAAESVIRSLFAQAEIRSPAAPGFCTAVRENWQRTRADCVFHLEDDWLLNEPISVETLRTRFADARVAQIALHHREKNWCIADRGELHSTRRRVCIAGVRLPLKYAFPIFTTSPCFLRGDFARHAASLLDCRFDPEKQFYRGVNLPLERYVRRYQSLLYAGTGEFLITDIGRQWRDARGIVKLTTGNASSWASLQPEPGA